MPHADSSYLPESIKTKEDFWEHISLQLTGLLSGQRSWVSNCANASSLIYNSLMAFEHHFGSGDKAVNWCGFYIDSSLHPTSKSSGSLGLDRGVPDQKLLLGPFCGRPACQFIVTAPGKAKGVCADAYIQGKTVVVPSVEEYPGHIACDGATKSEIVCPLIYENRSIGVLDLDCLALNGFDDTDRDGLERIAELVVRSCDW